MKERVLQFGKALLAVLFVLLLGVVGLTKASAQTQESDAGFQNLNLNACIEYDITQIATFDQRVIFLHDLLEDGRFSVVNSETEGVFIINADASFENINLREVFSEFKLQNSNHFAELDKFEASEIAQQYKAELPNDFVQSLMMDVYIMSRQNNLCMAAEQFCTDNGWYQYPAGVNSGNGETGPYYNCLTTTPNPAWFYLEIGNPGSIDIYMYSNPSRDLDFCCWGPYADPISPCPNGLTADKVVSCSYSASATEHCLIPSSAQTGQVYILVITNYSNNPCDIIFSQIDGNGVASCGPSTISVSASPEAGGTVSGGGIYEGGTCTVTANANIGYTFMYWTENGTVVSETPNYTFAVGVNRNLVAHFALPFNITAIATEGGTVSGGGAYEYGATCTLTAAPNDGYSFMYWTENGEAVSYEANYSFTVTGERNLQACFALPFTVSAVASPAEGGSVNGIGAYDYGTTCSLIATPNEGYNFCYWIENGEAVSYDSEYSFTVTGDRDLVAFFAQPSTIIVSAAPIGGGTLSGGGVYEYGTTCTLTAIPSEGYTFMYWTEGDEIVSNEAEYSFIVTGNHNLVAHFTLPLTISATVSDEDGGSVYGMGEYLYGTVVTLIGAANTGYAFVNWTEDGVVVSTEAQYSFTVTSDRNLVANFALSFVVSVSADPTYGGVATGAGTYCYGTIVTLTATSNTGYTFINWTLNGEVVSTEDTYNFTIRENAHFVANFGLISYAIIIGANIEGGGSVSGGGDFIYGSQCTLTAMPNEGYTFTGWSRDGLLVTGSETYTFIVTEAAYYVANFVLNNYMVSAISNPSEGGMVSFDDITPTGSYARITDVGQLVDGSKVILAARYDDNAQNYYAITNTLTSNKLSVMPFTSSFTGSEELIPNYIIDSVANYYWTVGVTSEGYTFTNAEGYMIGHSSATYFAMNNENIGWDVATALSDTGSMIPNYYGFNIINRNNDFRGFALRRLTEDNSMVGAYSVYNMNNNSYNFFLDIFLNVENDTPTVVQDDVVYILDQDWEGEMNGWTFVDVQGEMSWNVSSYSGNHYAYANGYNHGVNVDWCISPAFNLDNYDNVVLTFKTAKNYNGNEMEVYFSNDYDGQDPSVATWSPLSCNLSTGGWTWAESGTINLDIFNGSNCYIAFKYTCTESDAAGWEIDDILLVGQAIQSNRNLVYQSYSHGSQAILRATPNPGFMFSNWTDNGEVISTDSVYSFTVTSERSLVANFVQAYSISVTVNPDNGGTVNGAGTYSAGSTCLLTATANEGFTFVGWTINGTVISTNPTYGFTVNNDRNLVANFSPFTITATAEPEEGGAVMGAGTYVYGAIATLSAIANDGYTFMYWIENGETVSTEAEYSFTVTGNRDLEAYFIEGDFCPITFNLYDSYNDGYTGNYLVVSYGTITEQLTVENGSFATYTLNIPDGSHVALSWIVGSWPEDCSFTVNYSNGNAICNGSNLNTGFSYGFDVDCVGMPENQYVITAVANPLEGGTVSGYGTYDYGLTATLTATANTGYHFVNWTRDGEEVSTYATYTFTVTEDASYVANFVVNSYEITAMSNPTYGGTITGSGVYSYGSTCGLTAIANSSYSFTNWTKNGEVVSSDASYSFIVTENATYVANFVISPYYWEYDEAAYANTMSVVAVVQIDGEEQFRTDLEVGAFCGDECRGTMKPTEEFYYPDEMPHYYLFLTVHGNDGDEISFRLYDHSLNQELELTCTNTLTFASDNTTGELDSPYAINFMNYITQTTNFRNGWNWWSSYVELDDIDGLAQLEEGLGEAGVQIKSQSKFVINYGTTWLGGLNAITNEQTLKVQTNAPVSVDLIGKPVLPADHPITLNVGWNWIGYPCTNSMSLSEAFANYTPVNGDQVKTQSSYAIYRAGIGWIGALRTLNPGDGLFYSSSNGGTLVFPDGSRNNNSELADNLTAEDNHWVPDMNAYPSNMTMIAVVELEDVELQSERYELAAFAHGEVRGSARLIYVEPMDRYMAFLTVTGDEAAELHFGLYDTETDAECLESDDLLVFTADAMVGELESPMVVSFRGTTGLSDLERSLQVYPNPVNRGERAIITLPVDAKAQIEVVNALGVVVETLRATSVQAPASPGVYTLRITVDGKGTISRKLVVR